jgi:hypothetical protein
VSSGVNVEQESLKTVNELELWKSTGRRALRVARQRFPHRRRALSAGLGLGALVGLALLAPQHHVALRRDSDTVPVVVAPPAPPLPPQPPSPRLPAALTALPAPPAPPKQPVPPAPPVRP